MDRTSANSQYRKKARLRTRLGNALAGRTGSRHGSGRGHGFRRQARRITEGEANLPAAKPAGPGLGSHSRTVTKPLLSDYKNLSPDRMMQGPILWPARKRECSMHSTRARRDTLMVYPQTSGASAEEGLSSAESLQRDSEGPANPGRPSARLPRASKKRETQRTRLARLTPTAHLRFLADRPPYLSCFIGCDLT